MPDGTVTTDLVLRALLMATLRKMPVSEQIEVLETAGWTNTQIGEATGLTANAVKLRRRAKKGKE